MVTNASLVSPDKSRDSPTIANDEPVKCILSLKVIFKLYVRVGILFTRGKRLNDLVMLLRVEVWANKTSLTPPLFIEVPVPGHISERSCICVLLGVLILSFSTIFLLDFGTIPIVLYVFVFHLLSELYFM